MSERCPPFQYPVDRFTVAMRPGNKLACSFVPQNDNVATPEKAQQFLKDLDALAIQHGYNLECYGRLAMFLAIYANWETSNNALAKEVKELCLERSQLMGEVEKYKKEAVEALIWVCRVAERTEFYHVEWDLAEERLEKAQLIDQVQNSSRERIEQLRAIEESGTSEDLEEFGIYRSLYAKSIFTCQLNRVLNVKFSKFLKP